MDQLFGLPAHPLLVHVPVVLIPLAAIGVALMLIRPAWRAALQWPTLVVGVVGMLGAIFAASSGEALEHDIAQREGRDALRGVHEHVEAGETARNVAIVFAVALVLYVAVPWFIARRATIDADRGSAPRWLGFVLAAVVALSAVGAVVTVIDAGHSGAAAVWESEYGD